MNILNRLRDLWAREIFIGLPAEESKKAQIGGLVHYGDNGVGIITGIKMGGILVRFGLSTLPTRIWRIIKNAINN